MPNYADYDVVSDANTLIDAASETRPPFTWDSSEKYQRRHPLGSLLHG